MSADHEPHCGEPRNNGRALALSLVASELDDLALEVAREADYDCDSEGYHSGNQAAQWYSTLNRLCADLRRIAREAK